ncbi:NlpC/P60 family protein [Streptacidiphilus sp. EB129]|uniref:C40 family peptidase n=1 Tax=Streptacidiphilus sp. EB129 TaxID=3156262 RepID=UPI00351541A1
MASHRRPKSPSRARITVLTAAAATTVALSATAAQSASAAPTQTTAQLQAEINQDNQASDAAIQQYDANQEAQQKEQAQVSTLQDQVARQQAAVNAQEAGLGAIASAQYRDGAMDPTVALMLSSNPTNYLNQASAADQIASSQTTQLSDLKTQQATLDREKAEAQTKLAALDQTSKQLAASKASVQQKLAAAQARMASLTAQQQAALAAAQQQATPTSSHSSGSGSSGSSANGYSPSGSAGDSAEATAFAAAQSRLGDVYVYGDTGPTTFDCSGLMMWSYAKAGITLGRTTYDQVTQGTAVNSTADLQIGDLVFFNGGEHVGMYAGHGMVLHAPHTGTVVKYEPISYIGSIYAMRHL